MAVQFDASSSHLNYLNMFCLCFMFLQLLLSPLFSDGRKYCVLLIFFRNSDVADISVTAIIF